MRETRNLVFCLVLLICALCAMGFVLWQRSVNRAYARELRYYHKELDDRVDTLIKLANSQDDIQKYILNLHGRVEKLEAKQGK